MMKLRVGVSGPHLHLCQEHWHYFFHDIDVDRDQVKIRNGGFKIWFRSYASTPMDYITDLAIVGPIVKKTVVELPYTIARRLVKNPKVRRSNDLEGTDGCMIFGPHDRWIELEQGLIVPRRHIHMSTETARLNDIHDGDLCSVSVETCRALAFRDVIISVSEDYEDYFHIDTDEANAAWLKNDDIVEAAL